MTSFVVHVGVAGYFCCLGFRLGLKPGFYELHKVNLCRQRVTFQFAVDVFARTDK